MPNRTRSAALLEPAVAALTRTRLIVVLEPAVAVLFFVLWVIAEAGRYPGFAALVVLGLLALAIAVARLLPAVALGLLVTTLALQLLEVLPPPESTTWPVYLGALLIVGVISAKTRRLRWVALGLALPIAAAVTILMVVPSRSDGWGWVSWTGHGAPDRALVEAAMLSVGLAALGLYLASWSAGLAIGLASAQVRARLALRETEADLRAAESELFVVRDRDRIAMDVHDVVAHSLAVVIAQADGARFLGETQPESMRGALRDISAAARTALLDVQLLVERLREDAIDLPQPTLAELAPLLDRVRAAGMEVEQEVLGTPKHLSPAQELAVVRIVQESLTNALKHAGRTEPTRISLDWRGLGLALSVVSPAGPHAGGEKETRTPHGLRGMRERARLAGGWLSAGREEEDDRFIVTAFLPAEELPSSPELGDAVDTGSLVGVLA